MNETIHWTKYWAHGNITSLPQDFIKNYDNEISNFWSSNFSSIANNSNILDICCGNGAVAILAAEFSRKHNKLFQVSAVDSAEIDIEVIRNNYPGFDDFSDCISFISGQKFEHLALKSANFDLITSQYGFEYCDLNEATDTILHLLKQRGLFALITHAIDSDMFKVMKQEEIEYQVLVKSGFFQLFESIEDTENYSFYLRMKIRKLLMKLNAEENVHSMGIIASVVNTVTSLLTLPLDKLDKYLDDLENFTLEHLLGYKRLNDFLSVNNKLNSKNNWLYLLQKRGLKLKESGELLYSKQYNAGNYYVFEKTN